MESNTTESATVTGSVTTLERATTTAYRVGNTDRWVLPKEILWAYDGLNIPGRIRRLLSSDGRPTTYSNRSRNDPSATLGTVMQSVRFLLDREIRTAILGREMRTTTDSDDREPTSTHQ